MQSYLVFTQFVVFLVFAKFSKMFYNFVLFLIFLIFLIVSMLFFFFRSFSHVFAYVLICSVLFENHVFIRSSFFVSSCLGCNISS